MSIRTRFTVTVVIIVAVTVALFATFSIVALDRTLRSNFNARLHAAAQTIASTVDVHHGRIALDAGDLRSLAWLHADIPFAVYAPNGRQVGGDLPPAPGQARALTHVDASVTRRNRTYGSVTVWQSDAWIGEFDRDATLVSIAVGLLLIALATFASRRVAKRVLAPVGRIASLAESLEAHDLSGRLGGGDADELGRLCASFDRMLDRLQSAFSRERRFVADASHELRAPLAVLRAETELALRRQRSNEEYRAALLSIERESVRLEELLDELLTMASAGVEASSQQTIDVGELVRRLGDRIRPAAAARSMDVLVYADEETLAVANWPTLERALLAIVHNAIAYGRDDGVVRLRTARVDGSVSIEVADDGPGFSADALAHGTERFWRGDMAHPRGGTGLGLAIARTIVEANRGTLRLHNGDGGGAIVTVDLIASP